MKARGFDSARGRAGGHAQSSLASRLANLAARARKTDSTRGGGRAKATLATRMASLSARVTRAKQHYPGAFHPAQPPAIDESNGE